MKKIFISVISIVFAACLALFAFGCDSDKRIDYFTPEPLENNLRAVSGDSFYAGILFKDYYAELSEEQKQRSYFLNYADEVLLTCPRVSISIYPNDSESKYAITQYGYIWLNEYGTRLPIDENEGGLNYSFYFNLFFKPLPDGYVKTNEFDLQADKYAKEGVVDYYIIKITEHGTLIAECNLEINVDISMEKLEELFEKTFI